MKKSKIGMAIAGIGVASALVLTGCSAPQQQSEVISGTEIRVAWNDSFREYNNLSVTGNAAANANIVYLANKNFVYYDDVPKLIQDKGFGTYEKTSDSPLTIKYTINDGVKWSDGTPVDAADMLLNWAANTTQVNSVSSDQVKTDPDTGAVTDQGGGIFFNSGATKGNGLDLVSKTPTIGDGGRSLTYVYDKPYVDWEVATGSGVGVAAHGTMQLAFPDKKYTGDDAKKALIKAIQD